MPATRVIDKGEVSINAVRYKIKDAPDGKPGLVAQQLTSQYVPKYVIGDTTKDSHQRDSVWAPRFHLGIGKERVRPGEESDRAWWSTCQLLDGHTVLPQLATTTAASGVSGSFSVGAMGVLANELYAAFGTAVRKYNNTTDSWGSTLATLPGVATDAITFRMNNVVRLAFATTGGYTYTSDGVTWTDDTRDTLYMAYWDDRLWGIDNTGLLWWSSQIGSEQDDAQLPLPDGSVNALLVARNAAGVLVLFAATRDGIFSHDSADIKWLFTELTLPNHPDNGRGSTRWRDSMFIPHGMGIHRYIQGANSALATLVGPDLDDGLPSDQRGVIRQLIGGHNDLFAILDSTSAPGALTTFPTRGMTTHHGVVIDPDVGFSSILKWNEHRWETAWLGGSTEQAISAAIVANAYSTYRLYWAQNQRVYYMPLQRDIQNPRQNTTLTYAATTKELLSPWLDIGNDSDGVAASLKVETGTTTSSETVVVDYAINYSTTYTALGTITSNGVTEYLFPDSTTPEGTAFRQIRFRLRLVRGSTTTLSPDVISLTFLYRKKLPPKYRFTAELDLQLTKSHGVYKNNTSQQLRDALRTAMERNLRVELSYHNDTGTDLGSTDRRFYVDIDTATNLEETGDSDAGFSIVTMTEG